MLRPRVAAALGAGGLAAALACWPAVAAACPTCAVGRPSTGASSLLLLGAMLLLPFVIAGAVILVLRRLGPRGRALAVAGTLSLGSLSAWAAPSPTGPRNSALPSPMTGRGWWLPPDASVDGWRVDTLLTSSTIFIGVVFAVVVIWMVLAVVLGRSRPASPQGFHKVGVVIVALCVAIIAVEDGRLFLTSLSHLNQATWAFAEADAAPDTVRIQVNARQWAWEARYAGSDGRFNTPDDIVVLNHLRVPVGSTVLFQLASTDVIHGFSLPNFRVKQDAVPGSITWMRLTPRLAGDFAIACQQHCGVGHYKMKGVLTVVPRADYDAWVERASGLAKRAYDPAHKASHWGWEWKRP